MWAPHAPVIKTCNVFSKKRSTHPQKGRENKYNENNRKKGKGKKIKTQKSGRINKTRYKKNEQQDVGKERK